MKTGDLSRLFGVSTTTIKNWCSEFDEFLSNSAKNISSRQRAFTEDDMIVLATIAKLSVDGLNYEAIHKRLAAGERVEDVQAANFGVDTRMIPAAAMEQVLDATEIRLELEQIRAERDGLVALLERSNTERDNLHRKIDELNELIQGLRERIGRAEAQAEIWKDELNRLRKEQ